MNKTVFCEIDHGDNDCFEQLLYLFLGCYSLNFGKGISIDKGHENAMTVGIDGGRHWEFILMEQLHEQKLSY